MKGVKKISERCISKRITFTMTQTTIHIRIQKADRLTWLQHVVLGAIDAVEHEGRVFEVVPAHLLHHRLQRLAVGTPGAS